MSKLTKTLSYCYSKKFKCYSSIYHYQSNFTQHGSGFETNQPFDNIHNHIEDLISCIREEFSKETFVRLTINTENLQGSIRIPYYKVSNLNSEIIYETVSRILQSSQVLEIGKWFVTVHSVSPNADETASPSISNEKFDGGSKRRLFTEPIFDWLTRRDKRDRRNRNVFELPGDDNLCLIKVRYPRNWASIILFCFFCLKGIHC